VNGIRADATQLIIEYQTCLFWSRAMLR